jgi:hypothetical protein
VIEPLTAAYGQPLLLDTAHHVVAIIAALEIHIFNRSARFSVAFIWAITAANDIASRSAKNFTPIRLPVI